MSVTAFDNYLPLIKNHIDEQGGASATPEEDIKRSTEACEALARCLLGCTLVVRGKRFVIRMLEIYYGGVADTAHDWYRNRFVYKKSKYKEHSGIQAMDGFRVYLSSPNVSDSYTRFDIVVGQKDVPVSFLVRSVWDENFKIIGANAGSPNLVLQALGLQSADHGATIEVNNPDAAISLLDTHNQVLLKKGLKIKTKRRKNISVDFEKMGSLDWNLYLEYDY